MGCSKESFPFHMKPMAVEAERAHWEGLLELLDLVVQMGLFPYHRQNSGAWLVLHCVQIVPIHPIHQLKLFITYKLTPLAQFVLGKEIPPLFM